VDRLTIYHWLNAWEARGLCGLYDKPGRGRPPKLNAEHQAQIQQWIKLFPKNLKKICALVQETYDIVVSTQTIKRVLHALQFSWHRIRRRVKGQPDPQLYQERRAALDILIEEDQHGIIDLRYVDESGFCLVPYVPYAWQAKGEPLAIESMPSKRLNVLGFLNKRNELDAYTFEGTVTSDVVIHCIDDFCKHLPGPTVVVTDNASIHTSEAFQAKIPGWEKKGLAIFYLPEYSPELNLIEILWRFMKYEWIEFWAYTSWEKLVTYVEEVIKCFGEKYKINFV
jgi:transposase